MEPLSIVGAVSSIVAIIEVATRCISSLRALQQRWTGADWTVNLLVGQLATLKAALDQIREWSAENLSTEPQHHQLVMDLDTSLESCKILIAVIDSHVSTLEWDEADTLTFESKAKAVWKDQSIQDCVNHLHHQTAALTLLLTALNCRSLSEQRDMLLMSASRSIIDQVKDDSSSLLCLRDCSSFRSSRTSSTDRSSLWSRTFGFDHELLASGVYQSQIRSLMRRAFRRRKTLDGASSLLARPSFRSLRKPEISKSAAIEHQLHQDRLSERVVVKICLFGSQNNEPYVTLDMMNLLRFKDYSPDERACYRHIIFQCILDTMAIILQELSGTDFLLNNASKQGDVQKLRNVSELQDLDAIPPEVAIAIASLWRDEAVKRCYQSCKLWIHWRAPDYYLDSIKRIAHPEYIPNNRDLLFTPNHSRMIDSAFDFGQLTFRFVRPAPDLMGRLGERLALFEDYVAFVFEVDVSLYDEMYDETLFYEPDASREGAVSLLDVAFSDFRRLCAAPCMGLKSIILVLNKYALFREKIRTRSDLQTWYPEYTGHSDEAMATEYIVARFKMLNRNQHRHIHTYFVEDDDPNFAHFLRMAVNDSVMQHNRLSRSQENKKKVDSDSFMEAWRSTMASHHRAVYLYPETTTRQSTETHLRSVQSEIRDLANLQEDFLDKLGLEGTKEPPANGSLRTSKEMTPE